MKVDFWEPGKYDYLFEDVAVERLVEAAKVVQATARAMCPVGTERRTIARRGKYAGQTWTARSPGRLKESIRVVQKLTKGGRPFKSKKNVRVYAGHWLAYYARIVEKTVRSFMEPAVSVSLGQVKQILGVK